MTHFILVRHGETEWNRNPRFRGQSDVPLNATGLAQAAAAGRAVAGRWQPVAVYHSPLGRARQTAEAIAAPLGLAAQPHGGLLDIHFGQLQGLTVEEAQARLARRGAFVVRDAGSNAASRRRGPGRRA